MNINRAICVLKTARGTYAMSAEDWEQSGCEEVIAKGLRWRGWLDGIFKAVEAETRWITMHPNGKGEKGVPVRIRMVSDGTWHVTGGAGGKLNGMRMHHVKSEEEYKEIAKERQKQKKLKRQAEEHEKKTKKLDEIRESLKKDEANREKSDDDLRALAHERLQEQEAELSQSKKKAKIEIARSRWEAEDELIRDVAEAAGWDTDKIVPSEEAIKKLKREAEAQRRQELERAINKPEEKITAAERQRIEKMAAESGKRTEERVKDAYRRAALAKTKEYLDNQKEVVADAGEELASVQLGEVKAGDLVASTFGDSGKGFTVNLEEEAAARGIALDPQLAAEKKAGEDWDSLVERKDGDFEKASKARETVMAMQARAETTRKEVKDHIEKLGMAGTPIEGIAELDAMPKAQNTQEAVNALAKAKKLQEKIKAAETAARAIDDSELDAVPTAVIVQASELTDREAVDKVLDDINEQRRTKAMERLVGLYDQENQTAPLRSHVLAGQSAYLSNVAQAAGVMAPDPLVTDILGEGGSAQLMHVALAQKYADDPAKLEGVKRAIEKDHIEKQVEAANKAAELAEMSLKEAAAITIPDIEDMDDMDGALALNQQKLELHREAREIIGLAAGNLQSAGAMNYALSNSPVETLKVPLGAMSTRDAIDKAAAIGLELDDYRTFNDGKNKFLIINETGVGKLAESMLDDPAHSQRAALMEKIKSGGEDEEGWLPAGFSRRTRIDISSGDDAAVAELSAQFNPAGYDDMNSAIKGYIAQRVEAGHDPVVIASDLRSQQFIEDHVSEGMQDEYNAALGDVVPLMKQSGTARAGEQKAHQTRVERLMNEYHRQHITAEAKRLGLTGEQGKDYVSVQKQVLPNDDKVVDVLHQVNIREPGLRHAFTRTGDLDRDGRRAVRDYAYGHILTDPNGGKLDPKDAETPIEALSPQESQAFQKWNEMRTNGDPYEAIQSQWRRETESGGAGLFGDAPKQHDFSTVDLSDNNAIIEAAKRNADALGYSVKHTGLNAKTGSYDAKVIPELEVAEGKTTAKVASDARKRIQRALMERFVQSEGADSKFNPENVKTASNRWAEYVSDMGEENNAYNAIQDHMKGDFLARFASGYRQTTGESLRGIRVPVASADRHAYASLPPEQRQAQDALKASERAQLMNRAGGKFAEGSVTDALEAKRGNQAMEFRLFGEEEGKSEETKSGMHRYSMGNAIESAVAGLIPNVNLKHGTSAIGDINMSSGDYVRQQRAVKQIVQSKRMLLSAGVGSGKSAISLAALSQLRHDGKVKRAIFAVPSVVQSQFGSEAARFYDPTSPAAPKWVADPSLSSKERRASYSAKSGYDAVVVTHQALRDDLNWALAQERFRGDERASAKWMAEAPEAERNAAVQQAAKNRGWDFEMSIVDEGHSLLNRAGKANSAMANTLDAFTNNKEYHVSMSADPVKNDASEAFSALQKVAPQRYVNEGNPNQKGVVTKREFLRKYGANTIAAKEALQREMAPYQYATAIKPDIKTSTKVNTVPMPDGQKKAMQDVKQAYRTARRARRQGKVDIDAVKVLSPNSFKGVPASEHEATAKRLQENIGIIRDTAYDRVVNQHPDGAKMRWLEQRLGLANHSDIAKTGVEPLPTDGNPKIIFAHNIGTVDSIVKKLEASGIRVGKMTGQMTGKEKEEAKIKFSPQFDSSTGKYVSEPEYDVLVTSDAGAVGWNGQRANHVINYDIPHTAMTVEQRNGRSVRTGQRSDVALDTVMTDTPYERKRYERLERKSALREALTTPAEAIDDSGLAGRIARETDLAREKLVRRKARKKA